MREWFFALGRFLSVWIVGQGFLLWLANYGIRPQHWVAWMLGMATDPNIWGVPSLVFTGAIAFSVTLLWEWRIAHGLWKRLSAFPWRIRIERIDQPSPAAQTRPEDDWGNFRFRISTAIPALAEPLAKFVIRADKLMEWGVLNQGDFDAWKRGYQDWIDDVLRFTRTKMATETKALLFSEIDAGIGIVDPLIIGMTFNDEHKKLKNRLRRQREELRHWHAAYV